MTKIITQLPFVSKPNEINLSKVDNIEFDDINHLDYPDYSDAYICSAGYNGKPMTEEQLDELNDDSDFKYEKLHEYLH